MCRHKVALVLSGHLNTACLSRSTIVQTSWHIT